MRKGKHTPAKRAVKHTAAEKMHLKRLKKNGACGKRRAERRKHLQREVSNGEV